MLEPLFELLAELFLFRWVWGDDRDDPPAWVLFLLVLVLVVIAAGLIWLTGM